MLASKGKSGVRLGGLPEYSGVRLWQNACIVNVTASIKGAHGEAQVESKKEKRVQ